MSIGYACLAIGVHHSSYRTLRITNYSEEKMKEIIEFNLESLSKIIDYNILNNIKLFRITSDLIPFGSSEINKIQWWDIYKNSFDLIGKKIKEHNIRVSMHPGQYTVINSPKDEVVSKSFDELIYHEKVLDALGVDYKSKLVLHIGGVYGDKDEAIKRFITNFNKLPNNVKKRLVIENDEKNYNIEDVLKISNIINIPVVFDNLHHYLNPPNIHKTDNEWINLCRLTWKEIDGNQKIHYSEQDPTKQTGSHSYTINHNLFLEYYNKISLNELDIMLEVKDKNVSAIKIINSIDKNPKIGNLEKEWSKYKYNVLEYSKEIYDEIRELLKDKDNPNPIKFYDLITSSFKLKLQHGNQMNALMHVYGYFKKYEEEKNDLLKRLKKVEQKSLSIKSMKNYLYKLAIKYDQDYLLNSYYFEYNEN